MSEYLFSDNKEPSLTHPLVYAGYLFFQLYSHTTLYQDKGEHVIVTTQYTEPKFRFKRKSRASKEGSDVESAMTTSATQAPSRTGTNGTLRAHSLLNPLTNAGPGNFDTNQTIAEIGDDHAEEEEEEEKVQMNLPVTVGLLVTVTVVSLQSGLPTPYQRLMIAPLSLSL